MVRISIYYLPGTTHHRALGCREPAAEKWAKARELALEDPTALLRAQAGVLRVAYGGRDLGALEFPTS